MNADPISDPLHALQGEVAFAALNPAHVGAVHTDDAAKASELSPRPSQCARKLRPKTCCSSPSIEDPTTAKCCLTVYRLIGSVAARRFGP
jgi:hypothetical protein